MVHLAFEYELLRQNRVPSKDEVQTHHKQGGSFRLCFKNLAKKGPLGHDFVSQPPKAGCGKEHFQLGSLAALNPGNPQMDA